MVQALAKVHGRKMLIFEIVFLRCAACVKENTPVSLHFDFLWFKNQKLIEDISAMRRARVDLLQTIISRQDVQRVYTIMVFWFGRLVRSTLSSLSRN